MFVVFSLLALSGLHLAVLHSQQAALKSLTQVVSALPGEEVLNMRNHLYQVLHIHRTQTFQNKTRAVHSSVCNPACCVPDSFAPGGDHAAERGGGGAANGRSRPHVDRSPRQHSSPPGVTAGRGRSYGPVSTTTPRSERTDGAQQHSRYTTQTHNCTAGTQHRHTTAQQVHNTDTQLHSRYTTQTHNNTAGTQHRHTTTQQVHNTDTQLDWCVYCLHGNQVCARSTWLFWPISCLLSGSSWRAGPTWRLRSAAVEGPPSTSPRRPTTCRWPAACCWR